MMPDFPTNPNPAPPNGAASTLPDDINYTGNPWAEVLDPVSVELDTAANTVSLTVTVNTTGTTLYAALVEVGAKPPTHAEIVAGTGFVDAASGAMTDGVPLTLSLSGGGYLYFTMVRAGFRDSDVYFTGEYSDVGPGEGAYTAWGTGVNITPNMPPGIAAWDDGNRPIAVAPITAVIIVAT